MAQLLARARAAVRSLHRAVGNEGAVVNVQTHLAAAAEARAAVDRLAWRLALAERARAAQRAADVESLPLHAA
jgi:hypothetical protein